MPWFYHEINEIPPSGNEIPPLGNEIPLSENEIILKIKTIQWIHQCHSLDRGMDSLVSFPDGGMDSLALFSREGMNLLVSFKFSLT